MSLNINTVMSQILKQPQVSYLTKSLIHSVIRHSQDNRSLLKETGKNSFILTVKVTVPQNKKNFWCHKIKIQILYHKILTTHSFI